MADLTTIADRYRILATIGRGGMGEVLKVEDLLQEGRVLALKRFRVEGASEALSFLRREFLTLAQLRHPNVATVYDFGSIQPAPAAQPGGVGHPGSVGQSPIVPQPGASAPSDSPGLRADPGSAAGSLAYFTAELVDGIDLFAATADAGWDEIIDLLVQVCRGLAYVHSRGIVHRDVKPSNVLVTRDPGGVAEGAPPRRGVVKIIDFGLALAINSPPLAPISSLPSGPPSKAASSEMPIRGTVHYLAPEALRGGAVDRRADLYALGVTAFEVATRRRPFPGATSREVIRRHLTEAPPRPSSIRPDVPDALEQVILRLLSKEPESRFSSAEEVIRTLGVLLGQPLAVETRETKESYVRSGRFVGRGPELRALREWLATGLSTGDAGAGQAMRLGPPEAHLALITGEPGIGKSRLAAELRREIQTGEVTLDASIETIDVACDAAGRAYAPFAEAVRRLLKLVGPAGEALLGPSAGLVRRFAGGSALSGDAAGVEVGAREQRGGDAARERLRLFDAVVTFLVAATWRRPTVIFVHDLDRADEGTVALLAHLTRALGLAARSSAELRTGGGSADGARGAADRPSLLVCATARASPGERLPARIEREMASLEEDGLVRILTLHPLGEGAIAELAATMLGVRAPGSPGPLPGLVGGREGLPIELERFVTARTGGNPFFLEELMHSLLEAGAVETHGGDVRVGALEAHRAPSTVTDVLKERMKRLVRGEAALLDALAVARRPVPLEAIEGAAGEIASPMDNDSSSEKLHSSARNSSIASRLHALERRGLLVRSVEESEPLRATWRFAHELLRETVYAAIAPEQRRRLHGVIATAAERAAHAGDDAAMAGNASIDAAFLAEHFALAGAAEKAFTYAVRAAREASALFANDRAVAHYERALDLRDDAKAAPAQVLAALEELGRVCERVGDQQRASSLYCEALARPDAAAILGPVGHARLHRRLGETCETRGEYDLALESFGEGTRILGEAEELGSTEGKKLRSAIASVYVKFGLYDDAIAFCRSGLAMIEAAGGLRAGAPGPGGIGGVPREGGSAASEAAGLHNAAGIALSGKGAYDDAARHFEKSLKLREGLDEPGEVAKTLNNLGAVYVERGQVGRAIAFFVQALERGEQTGDLRGMAETAANLGSAYTALGDDDRAIAHFRRALELRERLGDPEGVAATLHRLGVLECELGEYDAALGRLERARRVLRRLDETETRESVASGLLAGRLFTALGSWEEARGALDEALRRAKRFDGRRDEAEGLHLLGRLERAIGRDEVAEHALNGALTLYRALGNEVECALVTLDVVETLVDRATRPDPGASAVIGEGSATRMDDLVLARMIATSIDDKARELRAGRIFAPLELAMGRLAAAQGTWDAAAVRLEQARELSREGRRPELAWAADHALALACAAAGVPAKALGACVRAMEGVREIYQRVPGRYKEAYLGDRRRQALRADFQRMRGAIGG